MIFFFFFFFCFIHSSQCYGARTHIDMCCASVSSVRGKWNIIYCMDAVLVAPIAATECVPACVLPSNFQHCLLQIRNVCIFLFFCGVKPVRRFCLHSISFWLTSAEQPYSSGALFIQNNMKTMLFRTFHNFPYCERKNIAILLSSSSSSTSGRFSREQRDHPNGARCHPG